MKRKIKDLDTKELQAQLSALCYKLIAQGFGFSDEMQRYEELIAEIIRRGEKPNMTVKPNEGK